MLQSTLRTVVLKELLRQKHSGYSLVKSIEASTGWKPSWGSIYPLLELLRREGKAVFRKEGRRKIYSLTHKGKEEIKTFEQEHSAIISHMRAMQKVMTHLCDADHDIFFEHMVNELEQGELPYKEILKAGFNLRQELGRIYDEKLITQHKRAVIAILNDAQRKLAKIKNEQRARA